MARLIRAHSCGGCSYSGGGIYSNSSTAELALGLHGGLRALAAADRRPFGIWQTAAVPAGCTSQQQLLCTHTANPGSPRRFRLASCEQQRLAHAGYQPVLAPVLWLLLGPRGRQCTVGQALGSWPSGDDTVAAAAAGLLLPVH